MTHEPDVGELWRWSNVEDHPSYWWDELWLLLESDANPHAFLAINLESGEITTVFPAIDPDNWRRVQ